MRAQCCICADLFEYSASAKQIAATPCGHTFHEECLSRWMKSSSTCPSCRTHVKKNQVIKHLYFDICETEGGEAPDEEVCRLSNEVGNLKSQVSVAEKERDVLAAKFFECDQERGQLKDKLSCERSSLEVMRRDFALMERDKQVLTEGMRDYRRTLTEMEKMKNVDTLLKGCDSDIQAMISQYSEGGESSVRQLCSLATVMKREYTQALADKKILKDQISKLRTLVSRHRSDAEKMQAELGESRLRLEESNASLGAVERENNANRRKLVHLRKALRHNVTDGDASFVAALSEDFSPNVAFTPPKVKAVGTPATPRRSLPRIGDEENCGGGGGGRDSNRLAPCSAAAASPDLFDPSDDDDMMDSPAPSLLAPPSSKLYPGQPSPKLKFVKVPTASDKFQAAKKAKMMDSSSSDPPPAPPPALNILKRKLTGQSNSRTHVPSVSRVGYDGFGGTMTFVQPVGPPKSSFMMMKDSQKKKSSGSGAAKNKNICRPANQPKLSAAMGLGGSQKKKHSSSGGEDIMSLFPSSSSSSSSNNVNVKPVPTKLKSKPLSSSASLSSTNKPMLTADDTLGTIDLT